MNVPKVLLPFALRVTNTQKMPKNYNLYFLVINFWKEGFEAPTILKEGVDLVFYRFDSSAPSFLVYSFSFLPFYGVFLGKTFN